MMKKSLQVFRQNQDTLGNFLQCIPMCHTKPFGLQIDASIRQEQQPCHSEINQN